MVSLGGRDNIYGVYSGGVLFDNEFYGIFCFYFFIRRQEGNEMGNPFSDCGSGMWPDNLGDVIFGGVKNRLEQ